jgi:hypothetical protein
MAHCFGDFRRFRFNFPQRIAAAFLALFLAQGLWLILRQPLSAHEQQYIHCGRVSWTGATADQVCNVLGDGRLDKLLAGFSFTNNATLAQLLLRLPFLAAGCLLGGGLWWVTRRLFGDLGGYTALALYCFSPAILTASTMPNPEILSALGLYGGVYTAIGVAHAMQGPRRKWRPRIVLLTLSFAIAASAHLVALALTLLLALGFMLWVAEGRRKPVAPVLAAATCGALVLRWVAAGFSWECFRPSPFSFTISREPFQQFFFLRSMLGLSLAMVVALALYARFRRSRYFGNTTPLLCALICLVLTLWINGAAGAPWLWAVPFLLTFLAGVFADAYESARPRLALAVGAGLVLAQLAVCAASIF